MSSAAQHLNFAEAVQGLLAGDFSRLAPLFETSDSSPAQIVTWYERGLFAGEPKALAEAFSCACFNGCVPVVEYWLREGIDPNGGAETGMNAFHWAADRGQLAVVEILIRHGASLETKNMYGGTVLDGTVWSAVHETRPHHPEIIDALLKAGADVAVVRYPTGNDRVDRLLQSYGAAKIKSDAERTSGI